MGKCWRAIVSCSVTWLNCGSIRALRRWFDPEDFAQKTLIAAHADIEPVRAMNELQRKAWLRKTLLNLMKNALRDATRDKRDVGRDEVIENSSLRLEAVLAAEHTPTSEKAQRNEMALRLDEALQELPDRQRQAVVLKHYHGWTLAQIREHLGETQQAVVGLLHRGLLKLRERLPKPE